MTVASMTEAGMSTRAIGSALGVGVATVKRDRDAGVPNGTPDEPIDAEIVTPWRFPLVMVGINVVLVVGCLVLGAGIAAVVCASCAGYLAAVCRDARSEQGQERGRAIRWSGSESNDQEPPGGHSGGDLR